MVYNFLHTNMRTFDYWSPMIYISYNVYLVVYKIHICNTIQINAHLFAELEFDDVDAKRKKRSRSVEDYTATKHVPIHMSK